ncbi:MAG TPA: AMP-binding protein, partial [Kofleriaceae bacterium]|nr:AMP-binding protein [Kofleriaceae bacterium]
EMSNDRAHISEFRERAAKGLEEQRRDPDDTRAVQLAVARERKIWVTTRLTELGMERAEHWGWTNTYTYTKSLGEQIIAADKEVRSTIVRPAVVESSRRYPFPGWNEGFNTTAPLIYLVLKGHRQIVAGKKTNMDIVPVDYVAAGMIMATAAVIADQHQQVYQLATSGVNPVTAARLTELSGLAVRRHRRQQADDGQDVVENRLRARLEAFPVEYDEFNRSSAPRLKRVAEGITKLLDERVPRWGAPRLQAMAERARDELAKVSDFAGQVVDLVEMFKPFNFDHQIVFRSDQVKALHQRLTPRDREALPWDPETIDWREYWIESHFKGLLEWVFPVLDDEFGPKPRSVYTYKDLIELFEATTKLNRHRVAMRLIPTRPTPDGSDAQPVVYTYERVQDLAQIAAASLRERGIAPDDRVMIMSENRPEWGISYFGILLAGATAVPLDSALSLTEVANLVRASGSKVLLISEDVTERLLEDEKIELGADPAASLQHELGTLGAELDVLWFDDVLAEPAVSPGAIAPPRKADAVASLIYTSGTTGEPKGVMLTHKNLTSMVSKLASVFKLYRHDGLLSVLPLHHTFEFSAGFLMPLVHGSTINYLEEVGADGLSKAFDTQVITGMVGVPALWQLLHRKIFKNVADRGPIARKVFDMLVDSNRSLRDALPYDWSLGKVMFFPVHRKMGGRMRLLISGGSALNPEILKSFRGLGFRLVEGYGMTESSPVLTVMRPTENPVLGSVGRALPGVDVKIHEADEQGIGEVIARGPNVMKGYYQNETATNAVIIDGWLHTGDLGRLDDDGNLFIVGRKKEMILGASGENVYPDELEDLYGDSDYIKELSIVGVPVLRPVRQAQGQDARGTGETVAALVVPDYEQGELGREEIRERVREHMRETSNKLALYKRVKTFHLWDHDLPRTSTRKVKRREVIAELQRLERAAKGATEARKAATAGADGTRPAGAGAWVLDVIGQVTQKGRAAIQPELRLDELGFDSLMFTELGVALEAAGVTLPDAAELNELETVGDVETYVERHAARVKLAQARKPQKKIAARDGASEDDIEVPEPVARAGRRALRVGLRGLYERYLDTDVVGTSYVPPFGGYIVAANHSSHLDTGLVKHALGDTGELMVALAAKDYFFEDPIRKAYFENFTNLVPMERHGSLRESLRLAGDVIREGNILLIFPEGTRSDTGVMIDFKPSLGYLAMHSQCGILPMYLAGTYDAMPKGKFLPRRKQVTAHVAPYLPHEALVKMTEGMSRSEAYRTIAQHVEGMVRRMAPERLEWTLGDAGRLPVAQWEASQ